MIRSRLFFCCGALFVFLRGTSSAETHIVDSLDALQSKINDAAAGDTITLKNGVYATRAAIAVNRRGAQDQPITITAETVGEVEIAGTHGFQLVAPAAHIVLSGFKFTHAAGKNTIEVGTSHVRFTRNTFQCTGAGPYLSVLGNDAQIDHNEFSDKKTIGSMLAVGGAGNQVAQRVWIHHNYFHDFASTGAEVAEMIRFGLSTQSASAGNGIVEHNLLVRCRGENELISNRTGANTYRYNTLLDSPTSQFSLRHGNGCLVYGNALKNTEGLRILGDRHQVYSNYFEGNYIGVNIGNGNGEVAEGAPLGSLDRPDYCSIVFNTLVDNRTHYQMSKRTPNPLGATHTVFANNILQGGGLAVKIEGPYTDAVWSGNLLWNVAGPGDLPVDGFTMEDPLLTMAGGGILRPQSDSPAIDSATGEFPQVTSDFDGQARPEKKDRGADELGVEPGSGSILTVNDVGPNANSQPAPPPP